MGVRHFEWRINLKHTCRRPFHESLATLRHNEAAGWSGAGRDGRFHGCRGADFLESSVLPYFRCLYRKYLFSNQQIAVVIQTQIENNSGTFSPTPFFIYLIFLFSPLDCDKGPRAHWPGDGGGACTCALRGCCSGVRNKVWTCGSHQLVTTLYVYLPAHIIYWDSICILIMRSSSICITLVVRTGRASTSAAVVSVAATLLLQVSAAI